MSRGAIFVSYVPACAVAARALAFEGHPQVVMPVSQHRLAWARIADLGPADAERGAGDLLLPRAVRAVNVLRHNRAIF